MRLLHRALGAIPQSILDTQIGAGLVHDHFPAGYATLAERYLDRTVDKLATMSDWSKRPLSPPQIAYAAEDVALLAKMWDAIAAQLSARERYAHAEAACASARRAALELPPVDEAWRRIGGVPGLKPTGVAVLQELAGWRETLARANDQPARSVAGDGLIIGLAKRQPITIDSMAADRRMPKSVLRKHGETLVELIRRGAERPAWGRPRAIHYRTPQWRRRAWLTTFVEHVGAERNFSAALVCPTATITSLVLDSPTSRADLAARMEPWQDRMLGDDLWEALSGRRSLHLDGADVSRRAR